MYLTVQHITEYRYEEPAWDSFNELRLRPTDDYRQTLLEYDLRLEPKTTLRSHRDYYSNLMQSFHLAGDHTSLRIEANSAVVTYAIPKPNAVYAHTLPELRNRFFEFLAPTGRVPLNRNWFDTFGALRLSPEHEVVTYLENLTKYLHEHFTYQPNTTDVNTPLAEFAKQNTGVCQDYAHAMLAICRSASIPSRYVSGYVHSNPEGDEGLLGAEGSHAWIEAFLPGSGWVGYDPTNGIMVNEAHVKIGVGRDYGDVPPVSGLRRGGGGSKLNVTVKVRRRQEKHEAVGV